MDEYERKRGQVKRRAGKKKTFVHPILAELKEAKNEKTVRNYDKIKISTFDTWAHGFTFNWNHKSNYKTKVGT